VNTRGDLHVVFGTGPLGLAVMRELKRRSRSVRMANRSGKADAPSDVEVVAADTTNLESAKKAAAGASAVYHCAVPPYAEWPKLVPPLMTGIIEAAVGAGARLVYGDNLYAYGPVPGAITEDLPYLATGPNGRVRAQVATALMEAHRNGKVKATIGRASDFYGPHVLQSLVGERVFASALRGKPAQVLGEPDLPHTLTFIDDFARGLMTLSDRDEALGQVWHIPSAPTSTTRQFVQMVSEEVGTDVRLSALPEWAIGLLALFSPTLRALREQAYQRKRHFVVDHSKFERAFGANPTPHREAIRQTLDWYRSYFRS
jgi:nucleoside-diphosphate-sugar epimerase